MRLENYVDLGGQPGIGGLFYACGSFGIIDGNVSYVSEEKDGSIKYSYQNETIRLVATFTKKKNGVVIRQDHLENLLDSPIVINGFLSRFRVDGNAYEVYTQYNAWEHESSGEWQKLVTQVTASSQGIRTCDGATPMMALHNIYTKKNTVFHILPNAQWRITARKFPSSNKELVAVEAGFYGEGLHLSVAPGEKITLPTVIFFNSDNKTDLDAYKLHEVYNEMYPRKALPVIYNSWLYCFDEVDADDIIHQAECAAELGIEAFMIDAGWFGKGDKWWLSVGDWEENTVSGPKGRLMEISERVRELGMIFGLWFEPERASAASDAVKNHPEYYINGTLLDFANKDAVGYMLEQISSKIEKYNIGWVKFDFNASIPQDPTGCGFYRYMQGQKFFVEKLRSKFPNLYITNCASGGYRMELSQGTFTDSFWLSDNQGPYKGLDIVKNTIKRMPSSLIERWNVQKYTEDILQYCEKKYGGMISCNNATWDFIINVKDEYTKAFLTGGPMGFSCNLDVPDSYKEIWKNWILQYKKDRNFYIKANARILADSEEISIIEYSDSAFDRCVIQVFTKTTYALQLNVYPVVCKSSYYTVNGASLSGKELIEDGICLTDLKNNDCRIIELIKE